MFTDPVKNLKTLGMREDSIVVDLGAGTGYYSIAAGRLVPKGKVYAIEIIKDLLETIQKKIKEAHLGNVDTLWGNIEKIDGTKIANSIVDVAIASNILFQVEDKETCVEEIKRILKAKGRVLLIDWIVDSPGVSTKQALSKNKAREIFEKKGFTLEREIDAGSHHYGMIMTRL